MRIVSTDEYIFSMEDVWNSLEKHLGMEYVDVVRKMLEQEVLDKLEEKDERIDALEKEIESLEDEANDLRSELEDLQDTYNTIDNENRTMRAIMRQIYSLVEDET